MESDITNTDSRDKNKKKTLTFKIVICNIFFHFYVRIVTPSKTEGKIRVS